MECKSVHRWHSQEDSHFGNWACLAERIYATLPINKPRFTLLRCDNHQLHLPPYYCCIL